MKSRAILVLLLVLCLGTLHSPAATVSKSTTPPPGRELAQTLSLITGVAISPLFGVGAVGAWQYFHAKTPDQKAELHWYANPWFWGPALFLVALCFVKDTAGAALPAFLKKPFDVAESIEHKISGLVATGAFVPLAISMFQNSSGDGASLNALGFAVVDPSPLFQIVATALGMLIFFIVFLASNAVNILILLSPFSLVDTALKLFRGTVLASVALTAWANPWIGAIWALIVILFAYLIAGWSFRLSHFGLSFIWDFITRRSRRFVPAPTENKMFLARKIDSVPARTYGRLKRNGQGNLELDYRPWLILPERTLILPPGRYEAARGLFYSELVRIEGEQQAKTIFLLPPRYRGHEAELVSIYGLDGIRDVTLRAAWTWLKNAFGRRTPATT
ncbi:MAG TPA: hypothetical protein VFW05_00500 [Verrucomicrobiae bacterium]|nr:hypothetical protein [Verrucomicrobiae bacterium]